MLHISAGPHRGKESESMCSSSLCDQGRVIPKPGLCAAIDSLPDSLSHHFAAILTTSIVKLITSRQML